MRATGLILLLGFGLTSGQAQTAFDTHTGPGGPAPETVKLTGAEWRLKLIEYLISQPALSESDSVFLHGMGDEAASDVLKVLAKRAPLTAEEQNAVSNIIRIAFERPASIIEPVNKKASSSIFLLKLLQSASEDPSFKERVTQLLSLLNKIESTAEPK